MNDTLYNDGQDQMSADPGVESGQIPPRRSIRGRKRSENAGVRLADLYTRYNHLLWEDGFHKYCVNSFIAEIDGILRGQRMLDFQQDKLDLVISELKSRGNSNATINRKLSALGKLLKKAHRMGDVGSLPEIRRLKEKAGRIRFLSAAEEVALFAAIRDRSDLYADLCVFLVDTGARLGEAIGTRWADFNDGRVTFWITKSGRSRTIPLTTRVTMVADANIHRRIGPFQTVRQYKFRKVWNEAKREVGLGADPDVVPHILRHTCASRLVRGGVDIRRVQTWLGHQTMQMTMPYAHLATHDLDSCVSVLEAK